MQPQASRRIGDGEAIVADIRKCQVVTLRLRREMAEHVRISHTMISESRELMAKADRLLGPRSAPRNEA